MARVKRPLPANISSTNGRSGTGAKETPSRLKDQAVLPAAAAFVSSIMLRSSGLAASIVFRSLICSAPLSSLEK